MPRNIHEYLAEFDDIPGTRVYTAKRARQGYHLNQFAMSLMKAENRERFKADERQFDGFQVEPLRIIGNGLPGERHRKIEVIHGE